MKQLTYIKRGQLRWDEVPEPRLDAPTSALVRPLAVARCDLDAAFLQKNISGRFRLGRLLGLVDPNIARWMRPDLLKGPFPLGHECVAEVVEKGTDVEGLEVGARVVVPFQVSCGACPLCHDGLTAHCETHGSFDMYGGVGRHTARGGMLSDLVLVPHAGHMLVPLPAGLDPVALASASDNMPDAWSRTAPDLLGQEGKEVLVVGGSARSIGLYCVAFAAAMGAARVDYLETDAERLQIAALLGGNPLKGGWPAVGRQYDLVINGTNRAEAIAEAVRCLKPGGVCTSLNIYFGKSVPVPFFQLYAKNLTLRTGLANPAADLPAMLDFIARQQVDVGAVTTRAVGWDDAAEAMLEDTTKVVVHRAALYG